MEDNKVLTVPVNTGLDAASMMAMQQNQMFNNPWAYLILLSIFQNGGFGNRLGNNNGPAGAVVATDIDAKLNNLAAQISDNRNADTILSAIQGNTFAQSQLAQDLGVSRNSIVDAINTVNMGIAQLGTSTGLGIAGIQAAISNGNLNIVQQMKDCCCTLRTETQRVGFENQLQTVEQTNTLNTSINNQGFQNQLQIERQTNALSKGISDQGYDNQLRTIQQTQEILTGVRAENTLTRASIDAFRTAWENGRYQDLLQKNNVLQDRLNMLEVQANTNAAVTAAFAPLQAQVSSIAAHQLPTYPQAYIPGYAVNLAKASDSTSNS